MTLNKADIEDNAKWLEGNGFEFLHVDMYDDRVYEKRADFLSYDLQPGLREICAFKVHISQDKRRNGMCRAVLDVGSAACMSGLYFHTDWMETAEAAVKAVLKSFRLSVAELNRLLKALEGESPAIAMHKDLCRAIHAVLNDNFFPVTEVLLRRVDGQLLSYTPGHDYRPDEDKDEECSCAK